MIRILKFAVVFVLWAATYSYAQQVVTNTNANGAGSLAQAISNAYGAGGNQTITFNITPLAATYTINPGQLNLGNGGAPTSLLIDATTQPGYTGVPVMIIRGNGSQNGFNVNMSRLTIKGFIVQNYTNGYYLNGGTANVIESCWFGVNADGTTNSGNASNKDYGILVEGGGSVSIGSKTDFSVATRNLISGNGVGGIKFSGAGANCYVGNSYIGTDITGTLALANGDKTPMETEYRHGITISGTSGVTIKRNVISGNKSGGIDYTGNSGSSIVMGNKIGTDFTGTLPLGNRNFGLRVKGSGGHTIGGIASVDRNIISANGSNDYQHEQNTTNPSRFDWYNSCGIYLFNSGNNSVIGNYIGVDSTGTKTTVSTSHDMGNFYVGIKIDGSVVSVNNKVGVAGGGNVVGGNGFRSSAAAAAGGITAPLDGHGMIIKDSRIQNTTVLGNYVGVGADGTSKIGNMQDGISVQGSASTVIGGLAVGERNIIGDNTWGIFVASNYYDAQSTNCQIIGNYIGTNASGTSAIGNGNKPGGTEGGGIGIIHFTQNTVVQNNVVSGNKVGISLGGNSPAIGSDVGKGSTGTKINGNVIGRGANGTTSIKNDADGIYLYAQTNGNQIGVTTANTIASNGANGIYGEDTYSNTIQKNTISNNGGEGIILKTSYSNIIGGVAAGLGNVIANNAGNGISISDASSVNNSIHRNEIACNGGRGIQLSASANGSYAKPTFSGTATALVITGPVGSTIEVYSLDGCNNCSGTIKNKLQGKTFITSGPSPLNFAGTSGVQYTATASAGSTTAAHNTSEFSDCYSICSSPNLAVTVTGNRVCQGTNGTVTITSADAGTYQAYIGTEAVGTGVTGSGTVSLTIPFAKLVTGNNTIRVKVTPTGVGCTPLDLTDTGRVVLNPNVNAGLTITGNRVCQGTNGSVTISASEAISYQAYIGVKPVGAAQMGPGNITLSIPFAELVTGNNTISVKGTPFGTGCAAVDLTDTARVVLNPNVNAGLTITGNRVCQVTNGSVTIAASEAISYQAYIGTKPVGTPQVGPGTISLTIPFAELVTGNNTISVKGTPFGTGCAAVDLTDTARVVLNPNVSTGLNITGNKVCQSTNGTVTITASEAISYQAYIGSKPVGTPQVGPGTINLTIPFAELVTGNNTISVKGIPFGVGCSAVDLLDTARVVVNPAVNINLAVAGSVVCKGSNGTVTITASEAISYQAYKANNTPIGAAVSGPGNITLTLPAADLADGDNIISFKGTPIGAGCLPSDLANKATVTVNTSPKLDSDVTTNTPICFGGQGILTVVSSEKGKSYQVFDQNGTAASAVTLSSADGALAINLNSLPIGDHTLSVRASVPGCTGIFTLVKTAPFRVNKGLDGTLQLTSNSPICLGKQAVITIIKSESGVSYRAYNQQGDAPLSDAILGDGTDKTINLYALAAGSITIYFKATIGGCGEVRLGNTVTIKVNTDVKTDLAATVNGPVCLGNPAIVTVVNAEIDKTYRVFYGGKPVSDPKEGTGVNLTLDVTTTGIPAGIHSLSIGVSVPGCTSDTLTARPQLTINESPKSDLTVSAVTSPICVNIDGGVRIFGIQPNVTYQAFIVSSVSVPLSGPGPTLDLTIPAANLAIGWNKISIKATIAGCTAIDLADTASIKVNPNPNLDLAIKVEPATICAGAESKLTVYTSEAGVKYQAVLLPSSTPISDAVTSIAGEDIELILKGIPIGSNAVAVKAMAGGCIDKNLDSTVTVVVNKGATIDYGVTGKTVCKGEAGSVTILGSEIGVIYEAFLKANNTSVSSGIPGTGGEITIPVAVSTNPGDTIIIKAQVAGCGILNLSNYGIVITNDNSTSKSLGTIGSTICKTEPSATATVKNAIAGTSYEAFIGTNSITTLLGTGTNLVFTIPVAALSPGANTVTFIARIDGCGPVTLDSVAMVYLLGEGLPITGSNLVCYHSEAVYSVQPIPGIVRYNWTVPADAEILDNGQGKSTIRVRFGETSGKIILAPEGNIGACNTLATDFDVSVEPPFDGKIDILGEENVCLFDIQTISIDSTKIVGVDYVNWTWPKGIQILDTINKTGRFPLYRVKYMQTGTQLITATPHVRCSNTFGKEDTLNVRVWAYPIAEAGSYELVDSPVGTVIALDGTGSSVNGIPPNDTLSYKWSSLLEIYNNTSLMGASFKLSETETKVYLTIRNGLAQCPAIDSATISKQLDLDIPNVFSPNNDGVHDTWEIKNLHNKFPNATVEVFNKWGSVVYKSVGYSVPWDGTRNGEQLPVATYYNVIDFKNGEKPKVRPLTILR